MDINENLMLTNSFSKGMNTDVSDAILPNEQYRMAKNLRYVTDTESNSGELHLIEGVTKEDITLPTNEVIIATASVRDRGVIITEIPKASSTDETPTTKNVYWFNKDEKKLYWVFGPCTNWDTKDVKLSIVCRWEDDDNVKIYIASEKTLLMTIPLYDNKGENPIYKDIEEVLMKQNVFVAPPAVYDKDTDGNRIKGTIKPAIVQYAYRLYNLYNISTELSPLSMPMNIVSYNDNMYENEGYKQGFNSTIGLRLTINISDINKDVFNKIQIYRITYVQKDNPPTVELIKDSYYETDKNTNLFTFTDVGQKSLQDITIEELNSLTGITINPKVAESKENWLVVGNVKYDMYEFAKDYDASKNVKYEFVTHKRTIDNNINNHYISADISQNSYDSQNQAGRQQYLRSLRRGETYRYGIILYGENGERSEVKWIADIKVPDIIESPLTTRRSVGGSNPETITANLIGIEFTANNLDDSVVGYEIVRCERTIEDTVNIAQGVLSVTMTTPGSPEYKDLYTQAPVITMHPILMGGIYPTLLPDGGRQGVCGDIIGYGNCEKTTAGVEYKDFYDATKLSNFSTTSFFTKAYSSVPSFTNLRDGDDSNWNENGLSSTNLLLFISPDIYYNKSLEDILKKYNCQIKIKDFYRPVHNIYSTTMAILGPTADGTQLNITFAEYYTLSADNNFFYTWIPHTKTIAAGNIESDIPHRGLFKNQYDQDIPTIVNDNSNSVVGFYDSILFRYGQNRGSSVNYITKYDSYNHINIDKGLTGTFQIGHTASRSSIYYKNINSSFKIEDRSPDKNAGSDKNPKRYYSGTNNFAYIKLDSFDNYENLFLREDIDLYAENNILKNMSANIDNFSLVEQPSENIVNEEDSSNNPEITATNDKCAVGNNSYLNWCIAPYLNPTKLYHLKDLDSTSNRYNCGALACPIGPGGKSLVFTYSGESAGLKQITSLDSTFGNYLPDLTKEDYSESYIGYKLIIEPDRSLVSCRNAWNHQYSPSLPTFLTNITKYSIPYGGTSKEAKDASIYYSHGCYNKRTTTFGKNDTIIVFDGDTYIQMYEHVHVHKWASAKEPYAPKFSIIYAFPVETSINLSTVYGTKFSKEVTKSDLTYKELFQQSNNNASFIQEKASSIDDVFGYSYTQSEDAYKYNDGYSSELTGLAYSPISEDDKSNDKADYRLHYSQEKDNNEHIDSWSIFKAANYLDVDTRYGEITHLRLFKDNLIFWQEHAVGVVSLNDRQLLQSSDNVNLVLGDGGVLDRFDYISTVYGMGRNEYCDVQSDNALYFWDSNKREILAISPNRQLVQLSKVKGVLNYINQHEDSENGPILSIDNKYNEILFNVVNNETLVYSEQVEAFTSVYDIDWRYKIAFKDKLMLTSNRDLYNYNQEGSKGSVGFNETPLLPYLLYVTNKMPQYNKVFDTIEFGGRFYEGGDLYADKLGDSFPYTLSPQNKNPELISNFDKHLKFKFYTPLKQVGESNTITNREYSFRLDIPRAGEKVDNKFGKTSWGNRLRGKTMRAELTSTSNSTDFSLQYITTKYRISCS